MERPIQDHHDGHGLTESIELVALDDRDPNAGGASHRYVARIDGREVARIHFQHGPRNVEGSMPGVVEAAVLAVIVDRMRDFNAGPFRCRENSLVQTKCEEAIHWLKHRADDRARRQVLGKNEA